MKVKAKVNRPFMRAGQEYVVFQTDSSCVYIKGEYGYLICVDYSEVEDVTNLKAGVADTVLASKGVSL